MKLKSPEILRQLVRRLGLLVLLTLVGAIAGGAYGAVKTPTYVAQAYVVVSGPAGESPVAVSFAQAYGRIATTAPVTDKAAAALGSNTELEQATASTSPDAPVIEITATGTDAKRTAAVANAVAQALVDFGNGRKVQTRVSLSVLASASVPSAPSSPRPPLELVVGAAAGLLVGGLAVLAGVGRSSTNGTRPAPVRSAVAEVGRPLPMPTPITAGPAGNGAQDYGARAITLYADAPRPQYVSVPILPDQANGGDAAPNGEKIVGRAVVFYQDPR